ncbi:hypothetical protein HPB50_001367 [Hyalomma asiaticum]|uniref:Uncharacterized protein n=1 Tax=Hyalomma asiaticum TaxID=266040 RepID=A0ACB7RSI7_HYAAI|nr:hypothetical protein HPB50_001367 [Hyalomma asiaticum]
MVFKSDPFVILDVPGTAFGSPLASPTQAFMPTRQLGLQQCFNPRAATLAVAHVILHLLDISDRLGVLHGAVMELVDCSLPLLKDVVATDDTEKAFSGIDAAFMVASMPIMGRMVRRDLLTANAKMYKSQGRALNQYAKKSVKVLREDARQHAADFSHTGTDSEFTWRQLLGPDGRPIAGLGVASIIEPSLRENLLCFLSSRIPQVLVVCNPANTIAWVCSKYAPSIPKENFSALTRLDHNRAIVQIAQKLKVTTADVRKVIIWGNHSSTQFPDVSHASVTIKGQTVKVTDAIKDEAYFQDEFVTTVQERGTEIFNARKVTSAMSAAKAAADHVRDWWQGTPEGEWVSMAVMSDGSYGSPADVVFSYPVHVDAQRRWHIVQGLSLSDYARHKIDVSGKELVDERDEALAVCKD